MTREGLQALDDPTRAKHRGRTYARTAGWIALCASLLLVGCSRGPAGQFVLARRSLQIGGARQAVQISIPSPGAGLLSITVQERGISVTAAIVGASGPAHRAASPIARLGTITLVRHVVSGQSVAVRIESSDSPDISANVRISARLLPPKSLRARARRFLAAGDRETQHRNWQAAFDDYLAASRVLRHLDMRVDAAATRQEMAELAYGYLQRDRDSIALIDATLSHSAPREPAIRGTRLVLLAKALMYLPGADTAQVRRAEQLLQAAALAFRSTPLGRRELPRLTSIRGFLAYRAGRLPKAIELFERAAAGCKALGDWECFARARQNIAVLSEQRQNYPAALSAYNQALRSLDSSRTPLLAADISYNRARLEGRIGLFGRSEQDQRAAMRLYAQLGQCDHVRRSASSLGEMMVEVGSVNNAVTYLKRAATLDCPRLLAASQSSDAEDVISGHESEAATSDDEDGEFGGWPSKPSAGPASICKRPTFNASTQNDRIAVFQALLSLGAVAKADNHFNAASTCLQAARKYSFDDRTWIRLNDASGELELALQQPGAAQRKFDRALRLARTSALTQGTEYQGTTEIDLGEAALALGKAGDARRHARTALALASARADVTQVVAALRLLALSEAAAGHDAVGTTILRAAIGLIQQVPTGELDAPERAMYLATQYSVFADLTDLLAGPSGSTGETAWSAFSVAEQGHARSLRYAMMQASRERVAATANSGSKDYRALLRTLAASTDGSPGVRDALLLKKLGQLALRTAKISSSLDRHALAEQLQRLHATLVEYAVGRTNMLAFVTDGAGMRVIRLASLKKIEAAATALSERLQAPEQAPDEIRSAAKKLAGLILWPVRPSLTRKHIIFVPDGTLYRVPFDVLPWTNAASSALVLQHAQISEEPSALLLTQRVDSASKSQSPAHYVLVGDPVLRDNQWYRRCDGHPLEQPTERIPGAIRTAFSWSRMLPSLPGTRTEVLAISHIVHAWRPSASVQTLLGCAATPAALRTAAPSATVLHIATHGLVDARRPRLSALALTPDAPSGTDAAFQLLDILQLRLHARLVVLSACDSSRGRILPGEGVLGLAQAFLQAGARSVVASYWRVQDTATVQFMKRFYRHLLVDRLPVAAALRRTQLELAAASGTYNWAAFGVYGRPDLHP